MPPARRTASPNTPPAHQTVSNRLFQIPHLHLAISGIWSRVVHIKTIDDSRAGGSKDDAGGWRQHRGAGGRGTRVPLARRTAFPNTQPETSHHPAVSRCRTGREHRVANGSSQGLGCRVGSEFGVPSRGTRVPLARRRASPNTQPAYQTACFRSFTFTWRPRFVVHIQAIKKDDSDSGPKKSIPEYPTCAPNCVMRIKSPVSSAYQTACVSNCLRITPAYQFACFRPDTCTRRPRVVVHIMDVYHMDAHSTHPGLPR